jgi:hypothetical protein
MGYVLIVIEHSICHVHHAAVRTLCVPASGALIFQAAIVNLNPQPKPSRHPQPSRGPC